MKNKNIFLFSILIIFLLISFIFDKQILSFIIKNRIQSMNIFFIYFDKINGLVILTFFLVYFIIKKQYKIIKPYLVNVITVYILGYLIKFLVQRPRPGSEFLPLIMKSGTSSIFSFPSGHTLAAFSVLPFLKTKKEKIIWSIIALFIAFSRLYLAVHYLSDVIAGIILGLLIGYSIKRFIRKSKK